MHVPKYAMIALACCFCAVLIGVAGARPGDDLASVGPSHAPNTAGQAAALAPANPGGGTTSAPAPSASQAALHPAVLHEAPAAPGPARAVADLSAAAKVPNGAAFARSAPGVPRRPSPGKYKGAGGIAEVTGTPFTLTGSGPPRADYAVLEPHLAKLRAAVEKQDKAQILAIVRDHPLIAASAAVALMEYWPLDDESFHTIAAAIVQGTNLSAEEKGGLLFPLHMNKTGPDMDAFLDRLMAHPDGFVRLMVALLQKEMDPARALPTLLRMHRDDDPRVRTLAFQLLREKSFAAIGDDPAAWDAWWTATGRSQFAPGR